MNRNCTNDVSIHCTRFRAWLRVTEIEFVQMNFHSTNSIFSDSSSTLRSYAKLIPSLYICHVLQLQDRSTDSDFLEWHWKMRSSLYAGFFHCKLVFNHIQDDTFDPTRLQRIRILRSHYDSYLYGEMPEFLHSMHEFQALDQRA